MSHQDQKLEAINHQAIQQAVGRLMPPALFRAMPVRAGATWKTRMLAVAAFVWGCLSEGPLENRFTLARDIAAKIFRWFPAPGKTYEGFKKVLKSKHRDLKVLLMETWRDQMQQMPSSWTLGDYLVLAVDGSRLELPRTRSHEAHYAPQPKPKAKTKRKKSRSQAGKKASSTRRAKAARKTSGRRQSASSKAKKQTSPQMWLTLLWHVGTGLPWAWKTGPSGSSEREHLQEMLPELPENTLITADAGFVGYDFWKSLLEADVKFVIRVGGNVKLLRDLGYARQQAQTVFLWPEQAMRKHQPPLALRLIELHDGREPVFLVTNLTKAKLSDRQAATLYSARWGVELFFRTFKQTFQRRKLRSQKAEYAELEVDWALLALWGMLLVGQQELHSSGQTSRRQSPAQTIRAFQSTFIDYRIRPATGTYSLWLGLRTAVLDESQRTSAKTSRNYPKKKTHKRTTPPIIITATKEQRHAAKELKERERKIRLAA